MTYPYYLHIMLSTNNMYIYIYTECYIDIYTLYIQVRETLSHHSSLAHHFLWLETSSVLQEGQGLLVGTWRKADQHQKKPWNSGDESDELNLNLFFGIPTPLKNGVKVSWDDEIPNIWKKTCSKPPIRNCFYYKTISSWRYVWMLLFLSR